MQEWEQQRKLQISCMVSKLAVISICRQADGLSGGAEADAAVTISVRAPTDSRYWPHMLGPQPTQPWRRCWPSSAEEWWHCHR